MEPKRTADDRWVQIEYNGEAITVPLSLVDHMVSTLQWLSSDAAKQGAGR